MAKITTSKINLLLLLTLCLGYPSTLYAAQNDVDDEKAQDADNDVHNKGKDNQTLILKRPTADFQPLLEKGRPPGGSSTDIQYFKDTKSGKNWIGKCTIKSFIGASNYEEYREALGLAIYRFFGIITPEFAVSVQPVAPSVYMIFPHGQRVPVGNKTYLIDKSRPCIHIMTQFLDGFSTCGDAFKAAPQDKHKDDQAAAAVTDNDAPFMRAYKRAAKAKQPFHLQKNGKKYPLQGLGTMLALANFIYDMDCIGKSGGNLGYRIDDKGHHAQVVKIDPGMAFSFLEEHTNKKFHHNPMDRKTFFGTDESATLGYDQLTPVDQQAFAAMAKRILQTPRKALKQLIYGVVVPGGWRKEMANKLLDHLIARKSLFLAAFAPEIDDNLRKEIMAAKHRLVGTLVNQKGLQKQSKAQIAAYQKSLKELRVWEAKVAANRLIQQKDPKNNQAQKPSSVKEPFQLPNNARGDLFTGRQKERAATAAFFGIKRKKACAFQAITGVGGMGKTHLALHYAHACTEGAPWVPHRYDAILWLYAEAGLDSQFHALAQAWGKKDCKTAQEAVVFVYMALQNKNRTLLVFDNAEQSQAVAPYLPPQHQKGLLDILITTRNPALNLSHYGKPIYITLDAFTKEESRAYIQKVLGNKGHKEKDMDALWETVSGLPLALNHALQYIAKGECTLAKYPARFAEHQLRLGVQTQASPVVTSVLLSVLTLREEYPLIEPLLVTAAYLAPDNIPTGAVFTMVEPTKQQSLDDVMLSILFGSKTLDLHRMEQLVHSTIVDTKVTPQAKQQALEVLHKYGLLSLAKDGQTFDFHRLVQQVLCEWHRSKKGEAGHEALLKDWMAYFDKNLEYDKRDLDAIHRISPLIPHAYAIAEADSSYAAIEKAQADLYSQIGGHQCFGVGHYDRAKQCYEKALNMKKKHYGVSHIETANTMMNLGTVLINLGDYAEAKQYLEKALRLHEKHYGVGHIETASTMGNLGVVLDDLGDYAQAKQCYQKALKIEEKHYGADHPETARTMMNLGNVLRNQGDYAQAKQYFEKALKIEEKHYGGDHPETARTMMNLGNVLLHLGDYAEAKQYYEKALKIEEKHYGADHPETARTMMNLGNVLRNQGDYAQAKQYFEKALKIKEKHYGVDHPSTAMTIENLGIVLDDLGDYALAKQCYQKALKIKTQHYGGDHPETARTMMNLGIVLKNLGEYAKAKQCYQQALKIKTQHYGGNHPETAMTIVNLGNVLDNLGDYASAKTYFQKALKIFEQHYGGNHPETAMTIVNLGNVLQNLGDYASAKTYFQKALKIFEQHYGGAHPETAITIVNLGNVLRNQGDYAQAKQCYEKALKIFEQHYGGAHPETAKTIQNLGVVLSNLGEYAEAKQYYEKALKIKQHHYGGDHPSTAITMSNLGNVLANLGDYAQAKTYFQKALKIEEKHYGGDHPSTAITMSNLGNVLANLGDYAAARSYYKKIIAIFTKHYGPDHSQTKIVKRNLAILEEALASKSHQKQPKAPQINKVKAQELALIQATCHFVEAMQGQLAKTSVPAYLGSAQWDANAAPNFVAAVLGMCRKRQYPNALLQAELHGIPIDLVPFIKAYVDNHPQLQQVAQRPEFCESHLEKPLMLGQYKKARESYQQNIKGSTKHDGANHSEKKPGQRPLASLENGHPKTAETAKKMRDLAIKRQKQGDYLSAAAYYEKALNIFEQHYGTDHPDTAKTMENMGNVLRHLGDYTSAKQYLTKALKIKQQNYGADHPKTALTMRFFGILLDDLGEYAAAQKHLENALKIHKLRYGANDPKTAKTMRALGNVLQDLGDYAQAKIYLEKALKINTQHYGADHPSTASTINNLGEVLRNLGDYAEAKQCYEKALKIKTQHYGADHPETAITIENMGTVLCNLGDYAQAKKYFQKALKINTQHYGPTHPSTAMTIGNLGNVFLHLGDYAEAKQCYEKALKIFEQHYSPIHLYTAKTMENLGSVLLNQGDYLWAKHYLDKALKIRQHHYGTDHAQTAHTMGVLGVLFKELGQYAKAKECYQKAIKVFTQHYGPNHSQTKRVKRNLAILEEEVAAQNNKKKTKAPLDNPLTLPTDKPNTNKIYKVHKRPKDDASDDEKEHDTQHNGHIAPQQQPKAPKIDKAKQQEAVLIQATYHFVKAMQGQLAKTPVPAYLGSRKWDANAAATFVAAILRMCRKQQYPQALAQAGNHGIPTTLVPFIKAYIDKQPQLQQVVQRPDFCKSHLEKPLMLGQLGQLYEQCQPNEDKEVFDLD